MATKKKEWYQLKITLKDIKPPIWRRFVVESSIKLPDLHKVIQTVMGWTNSHLHQFVINGNMYPEPDEDSFGDTIDYNKIILNQVVSKEGQTFEYDFGDGWEHTIVLEKILDDFPQNYPVCLDGKRSCPLEDCGGPYRYQDLLKALSDPDNEEYKEIIEWAGTDFDPEYFDIDLINDLLQEEDYGCISLD